MTNPLTPPALFPTPASPRQADQQQGWTSIKGNGLAQQILNLGMSFIGTPYVWGGEDPSGFDCSGLLQYIFGKNGVQLPRVSSQQAAFGTGVSPEHARPGDLVAFDNSRDRPGVDHIGIYLGNGLMLQAPRTGKNVEVVRVNLASAATIRRALPENAFQSLSAGAGKWDYPPARAVKIGQGATPPTSITAANDGGDPASNPMGPQVPPGAAPGPAGQVPRAAGPAPTSAQVLGSGGSLPLSGFGTGPTGQYRLEDYGFSSAFFGSDPELKAMVDRAVAEQWTPEKFAIELRNTNWYRTRSEADRQWQAMVTGDPATANRQREIRKAELLNAAGKMGVKLTDQQMNDLVEKSLQYGFSQAELQRNLGSYVAILDLPWAQGDMVGDAGALLDKYKLKARAYGLTIPEKRIADFVREVMIGNNTEESFDRWVKEQAKALYPTMGQYIDRGLTIEDVASNYQQVMARTLEVDPTTVDFMKDPLIRQALFKQNAEGQTEGAPMSMWEFEALVKKDPRWQKTSNARDALMGVTGDVLRNFGFKF